MTAKNCITLLSILLIIIVSIPAAGIMKGMSTEELTKASGLVIRGQVERAESHWSEDGQTIYTSVVVNVKHVIKGGWENQGKLIVEYEGGEVGDIGLEVSDTPSLKYGEEILLFLKRGRSKRNGYVYNIVGKGQGKYTIDGNGVARKSGFSIAGDEEDIDNNIPVDVLIEKIERFSRRK